VVAETDLRFDERYYDSVQMPNQSPRTKREWAIYTQLTRLHLTLPPRNNQGELVPMPAKQPGESDSVFEINGGQPAVGWANEAQELADIHRKLDSLKVLEHIPLTPY